VLDRQETTRALVVEDDPNIVDLIRSNLAVRGFDTVVSADGIRTLQLLETEEPDIVLLDLMLPDLMLPEVDGFELGAVLGGFVVAVIYNGVTCSGSARRRSTSGPPSCCSPRSPSMPWPGGAAPRSAERRAGWRLCRAGIPGMAHWFCR
jgi:Response regulator receiver domain